MIHEPIKFTIRLAPITKKNSQRLVNVRGRVIPIPSKQYKQYEHDAWNFMPMVRKPIDYPVNVRATYFMPTRRKVDLTNLHEALHDVLVKYEILADDNFTIVAGTDGSRVEHDKENPRTEVVIEEMEEVPYQLGLEME